MPRYKAAFEDGTIEIPKDADVLADHRAIVLEQGVAKISERRAGSDGKGRHGDSAMAAALAFFASRAEVGSIAYISVPVVGKREWFERPGNPFGSAPAEDEMVMRGARGF
jgi:phage FluMu gp28-like protein